MTKTYFDQPPTPTENYTYPAGNPGRDDVLKHLQATDTTSDDKEIMQKILIEAEGIVCGDRHESYGPPTENHRRTAAMLSAYFGKPFTPVDVCMINAIQKISRSAHKLSRDGMLDIIGYMANAAACSQQRQSEK